MSKTNIIFNNKNYSVDDTALSSASAKLKAHLSTVMNGSGAVIKLGGTSYNVDSEKLAGARNEFITHLGTIAGESVGGDTLYWDGNTDGLFSFYDGNYTHYLVSDAMITLQDCSNGISFVYSDGNEVYLPLGIIQMQYDNGGYVFIGNDMTMIFPDKLTTEEGITFPKAGIWYDDLGDDTLMLTTSITIPGYTGFPAAGGSTNGINVVVNGVTYTLDSDKMNDAISKMHIAFGNLNKPAVSGDDVAGLYETGAVALYQEQGADAIKDMLITPWDELVEKGAIVVDNGVVYTGYVLPDNLPEKNEYGFYYDVPYLDDYNYGYIFREDGSFEEWEEGELLTSYEAGTAIYSQNTVDMTGCDYGVMYICDDGAVLEDGGWKIYVGAKESFAGDLILPNDGSITSLGDYNDEDRIGNKAFEYQEQLTGILIPDSVIVISDDAFNGCINLSYVNIPDGVTNIGYRAFDGVNITDIYIPDSVTYIGFSSFSGCPNLSSVTFGENCQLTNIACFKDCPKLTHIDLPNSIECIDRYAFYFGNLEDIVIPNSVTSIGLLAFANCKNLKSVIFENNSKLNEFGQSCFGNCYNLTTITIPSGLTTIGDSAFNNCEALTSIIFDGTIAQWDAISKPSVWKWNSGVPATKVVCTDGEVSLV